MSLRASPAQRGGAGRSEAISRETEANKLIDRRFLSHQGIASLVHAKSCNLCYWQHLLHYGIASLMAGSPGCLPAQVIFRVLMRLLRSFVPLSLAMTFGNVSMWLQSNHPYPTSPRHCEQVSRNAVERDAAKQSHEKRKRTNLLIGNSYRIKGLLRSFTPKAVTFVIGNTCYILGLLRSFVPLSLAMTKARIFTWLQSNHHYPNPPRHCEQVTRNAVQRDAAKQSHENRKRTNI